MGADVAVTADVAAFLRGGVAVVVATRDEELRPEITRGWGPELSPDGCTLRLCLSASAGSRTVENLQRNGSLAATFSLPTTYRSVQVKGALLELAEPDDDDRARAEAHLAAFVAQAEQVGVPRAVGERFAEQPFVVATIAIRELYDQTPGAGAGAAL